MPDVDLRYFLQSFKSLAEHLGTPWSGVMLTKGESWFRELTGRFQAVDSDLLDRTTATLRRKCKTFPSYGDFEEVYANEHRIHRQAQAKPAGDEKAKAKGCPKCSSGWVNYLGPVENGRPTRKSAPCYYCNKGESGPWPYLIQDRDRICIAATRIGEYQWRAIVPAGQKPEMTSLIPLSTSADLEAAFHEGPISCPISGGLRQQFDQMTKSMEVA